MSTERDVTRIVRSWLEEGVTALPDRVLDNVLDRLPATHQRRAPWPVRRLQDMNTPFRVAIAAAAILVVALIGITILPRIGGVAAPAPTPTPSPTRAPTPAPLNVSDGPLVAGSYLSRPFAQPGSDACFVPPQPGCIDSTNDDSVRFTFTVPDGWTGTGQDGVVPTATGNKAPDGAAVLFVRGASLYNDPCRTAATPEIPVGPTVDAFVTALADHPLLDVTTPVDTTLAGYFGKYVDLQVPADLSACPLDTDGLRVYRPWEPWFYAQGPGQRWHLWVLDVHGVRVVVQSTDYAGTSPQHQAELKVIVESIQIDR